MKYYRVKYEIYKAAGKSWERMAGELLLSTVRGEGKEHGGKVVRPVFFTFCEDNREYQLQRSLLKQWVDGHFVSLRPILSFAAQEPLVGELVMEVHPLSITTDEGITAEEQTTSFVHYLRATSGCYREITAGGLYADDLTLPVHGQPEQVFGKTEGTLGAEQMGFGDIVHQWSYLERITGIVHDNQCYQGFNDIRSQSYAPSEWASGYPAATGTGTRRSGILVDFNAVKGGIGIISLSDDWQRAAHVYSDEVLVNHRTDAEKGAPKFERGKSLSGHQQEMIYISGTTAIRGEKNIIMGDVLVQTEVTLESIRHLIGLEEGREELPKHFGKLKPLHVYLKHEEDAKAVKKGMDKFYPDVPIVYLYTGVCRKELLVEIEGTVYL